MVAEGYFTDLNGALVGYGRVENIPCPSMITNGKLLCKSFTYKQYFLLRNTMIPHSMEHCTQKDYSPNYEAVVLLPFRAAIVFPAINPLLEGKKS